MDSCEFTPQSARPRRTRSLARRLFPFLAWWPTVGKRTLKADVLAGLTGAVIVLPQGVAFAAIAGLPPQYGLYAAMIPTVLAALFGSSHHLVSGPTTALSLVLFADLSQRAAPMSPEYIALALGMTFLCGAIQLGMGLMRMGAVIDFVSHSVVTGFTAGAAILIAAGQLGHFFGIGLKPGGSFLSRVAELAVRLPETNVRVLAVSVFTLLVVVAFKKWLPKWPGMLFGLALGGGLAWLLDGRTHGAAFVGALPRTPPPLSSPFAVFERFGDLIPGAAALAMLGLAEAAAIARAAGERTQQHIDAGKEFIGQGISNLVGSFFSAYASSGSFTRTGVNVEAGAKTPLAAVFAAFLLALVVLLVAPLAAHLPIAAMAGVILYTAYNLIDLKAIRGIVRTDRREGGVMAVTFVSALFIQLEFALFTGVILSLLLYLKRTSHPRLTVLAPDPTAKGRNLIEIDRPGAVECPQMKIVRLDGSLFFGAVNAVAEDLNRLVERYSEQCHVLVVGSGMNFVDEGGCHMLFHEARRLKLSGRRLYFCSLKPEVFDALERAGCLAGIGDDALFIDKESAIKSIVFRLDPSRCACCAKRVFLECAFQPGGEFHDHRQVDEHHEHA